MFVFYTREINPYLFFPLFYVFAMLIGFRLVLYGFSPSSKVVSSSMASSTIVSDSFIYINYVNVHLSINKLDGMNYDLEL